MHENEILGKKSFNFRIRITVQFNIVIVRFNSPLMNLFFNNISESINEN